MTAAGIDASLSSTGLADQAGRLHTIHPRAGAKEPSRRLDELETSIVRALRIVPPLPRLVLLEGPAPWSKGIDSTISAGKLRGVIELALYRLGIPHLEVEPSRLKRYATGNGNAPKDKVIAAAVADGATVRGDDEADAYFLRHLARAHLGEVPIDTPYRAEIVAAISWPRLR